MKPVDITFMFSQRALLDLVGHMEDKKAAYIQNIEIADTHKPVGKESKHSKKKSNASDLEKTDHNLERESKK